MHTPQPVRRNQGAFTLLELLVVIAIIALLVGLILPAVLKSRDQAHTASCASRMRQMGAAMSLYIGDNGAYPLSAWLFGGNQIASITWCEAIYPYLTGAPVPTSPADTTDLFTCPAVKPQKGALNRPFALTYQINGNRRTSFTGIGAETPGGLTVEEMDTYRVPVGLVPEPAGTFSVVDGRRSPWSFLEANTHMVRSAAELSLTPHNGLNNWLFCDGHVELINVTNTWGNSTMLTDSRGIWSRTPGD